MKPHFSETTVSRIFLHIRDVGTKRDHQIRKKGVHMRTLRNYTKAFFHKEEGMELLQLVIVVVITVALMGVVFTLKNTIQTNMSDANDLANNTLQNALAKAQSDATIK